MLVIFWRLNELTVGRPSTGEKVPYAIVDMQLDCRKLILLPYLVADYTIGRKSAKAAEKTAQAALVPATDPVCRIPQGRLSCNPAVTGTSSCEG